MQDASVERRFREEEVGWLTTVRSDGQPQPVPVWFWWDGEAFLIYSESNQQKLRNIRCNPHVALNLNSNATGDVVRAEGTAEILEDHPPLDEISEYVEKHRAGISRIGFDVEGFARAYSVPIRITPTRWHIW